MAEKKNAAKTVTRASGSVAVYIPREAKGDDQQYVAVNGVRALVKKGEQVYVSPAFAEVIRNSERQRSAADAYIAAVATTD